MRGGIPDRPEMILRFTREVEFDVRNSNDLRSIIIVVRTEVPKKPEKQPEVPNLDIPLPAPDLSAGTPKMAELMLGAGCRAACNGRLHGEPSHDQSHHEGFR